MCLCDQSPDKAVFVSTHDLQDEWPAISEGKSDRISCFGSKAELPSFEPPVGQCLVRCIAVTGTGLRWQCESAVEDHACVQLVVPITNIKNANSKAAADENFKGYELKRVSTIATHCVRGRDRTLRPIASYI